ncbi:MAG TPA: endolytic transglycosylase MltG [Burkholderiales bacterium]|nr:endolytic transglycosylase MltG [Burkholderiales bacterium]
MTRRWLKAAAVAVAGIALLVIAWCVRYPFADLPLASSPVQFSIAAGSSLRSATHQMVQAGVLRSALPFEILTRLFGDPRNIKAGNYEIERGVTPRELMAKLTRGDSTALAITLVEGWTFRQLRKALDDHPALRHDTARLTDIEILQRLGIEHESPEGLFFPDTFHFSFGVSDLNVLRRAHLLMQKHLAAAWARRSPDLPLASPYEALILASIIEKETGKAVERSLIAAVFLNRLKAGMKLQTDPTVIYGLGQQFDGNLRKHDLTADGPYNTYTRAGMPPTPIAMPGLASLHAAVNPAATDALYFVAKGDGSSHFSRSYEEHDRAVTKYQRGGRKDAR